MQVLIDKKEYFIPDTLEDLLFDKWIDLVNCSKNVPKEDSTEKEKLDFYLEYCSVFVPIDVLKKCKIVDDELGLIGLFNHLWQFAQTPEAMGNPAPYLTVCGSVYGFAHDTLDNSLQPMEGCTFEEYEEANAVLNALNKLEDPSNLALLIAILYRPVKNFKWWTWKRGVEPYDSKTVQDRADLFKVGMFMSDVWSCYFFFQKQTSISVKSIADSLVKEVEKQVS